MSSSKNSSSSSDGILPEGAERLQDVRCRVEVVLGTGAVSVRSCLALAPGSVVRLAQPAGADLQVLVNGVPIATGEVVVVDDATSIRVTDILPPSGTAAAS